MFNREQLNALHSLTEAYVGAPDMRIMPATFSGKLIPDDSDPEKPWVYLEIDKGIPESAYNALKQMGIPCEPRFDNPHITVIKKDEIDKLKEMHGDKWKDAVLTGGEDYTFEIQEMVDVDPAGWDDMDRVWFLKCNSPALSAKRIALELSALPTSEEGEEQNFHITVAVRAANGPVEESRYYKVIQQALLG